MKEVQVTVPVVEYRDREVVKEVPVPFPQIEYRNREVFLSLSLSSSCPPNRAHACMLSLSLFNPLPRTVPSPFSLSRACARALSLSVWPLALCLFLNSSLPPRLRVLAPISTPRLAFLVHLYACIFFFLNLCAHTFCFFFQICVRMS